MVSRRCLNQCWGRGACRASGTCECEPGFMGDDCASVRPCENDCSFNGLCEHGVCHCAPGWSGQNCSTFRSCPNSCSAHGVCLHGRCHCDPGYLADVQGPFMSKVQ